MSDNQELSQQSLKTESSPTLTETDSVKKKLEQIFLTESQLNKMKADLAKLIDAMSKNQSLLSRAATFWGERPTLQKVIIGAAIIVPTLVIGIVTNIAAFFVISAITLIAYVSVSLLFDNHHKHNSEDTNGLKTGINALIDTIGTVIESLGILCKSLGNEVERLQQNNEKLTLNVNELDAQIETLSKEVTALQETEKSLRKTQEDLETSSQAIKTSSEVQDLLFKTTQHELEKVKQQYEVNKTLLSDKIKELNEVKTNMGLKLKKVKTMARVLKNASDTLADTVLLNEEQRLAYTAKLNDFLGNNEAGFEKIANKLSETEQELCAVKEALRCRNEEYRTLLERQETLITRLEILANSKTTPEETPEQTIAQLLSSNGIYRQRCASQSTLQPGNTPFQPLSQAVY